MDGEFTPELLEALQLSGRRFAKASDGDLLISTLKGIMRATKEDYIILVLMASHTPASPIFLKELMKKKVIKAV